MRTAVYRICVVLRRSVGRPQARRQLEEGEREREHILLLLLLLYTDKKFLFVLTWRSRAAASYFSHNYCYVVEIGARSSRSGGGRKRKKEDDLRPRHLLLLCCCCCSFSLLLLLLLLLLLPTLPLPTGDGRSKTIRRTGSKLRAGGPIPFVRKK
jgi:hypothetical protein